MKKSHSRIFALFCAITMTVSLLTTNASAASKPSFSFDIPQEVTAGERVEVTAKHSSDVRKVTWTLKRDGNKKAIEKAGIDGCVFTPSKAGTYELQCTAYNKKKSVTVKEKFLVTEKVVPLPTVTMDAPAEVEAGVPFDVQAAVENAYKVSWYLNLNGADYPVPDGLADNGGTITIDEPGEYSLICMAFNRNWKHVSVTKKISVIEKAQDPEPAEMAIVEMSVPQTAVAGEPFDVYAEAENTHYVEWYVNKDGEDYPVPGTLSESGGTLTFDEPGSYDIIYMVFDDDWQHIHKTMTVNVLAAEPVQGNTDNKVRAMYSWEEKYVSAENEDVLQQVMEATNCNVLYQEVSKYAGNKTVSDFLQRRAEHGQAVYYLCGDASWAIEDDAHSMLAEVERAASLNDAAEGAKFVGIQFDVEPYCLTDFDENAEVYFAQYVENCKAAYAAAHEAGLLVELCIPYWWDSAYEFNDQLEDLIANACDSVAVMNYYKQGKEAKHISNELELCRKYDKSIVNITEMQAAGTHGLTENNTYYADGIDAVEKMWNELEATFSYEKLGYSYHYLKTMVALLEI